MKERLIHEIKFLIILLLIGLVYLAFVLITGIRIPCFFNLVTKFDCPACGITRMFVSMAKLDFTSAFHYNPVIFVTLPIIVGCLAFERITYIRKGHCESNLFVNILLWFEIVLLLIYGIIRNIG